MHQPIKYHELVQALFLTRTGGIGSTEAEKRALRALHARVGRAGQLSISIRSKKKLSRMACPHVHAARRMPMRLTPAPNTPPRLRGPPSPRRVLMRLHMPMRLPANTGRF